MFISSRSLVVASAALFFVTLFGLTSPAMAEKCKTFTVSGNFTGTEGVRIHTSNGDEFTCNFTAGNAGHAAQEIVDAATPPFTASRVGTKVTICHPSRRPKVEKVNLTNKQLCSMDTGEPTALSTALVEVRGVATGGGFVGVSVEDLVAIIPTYAGQTAMQVVEEIQDTFDAQIPEGDTSYDFGLEYTAWEFYGEPIDSVDLGIESMGGRDVMTGTTVESTDQGINVYREECSTPTLETTWGQVKTLYR